ncbi:hypothetical protein [Streptomyces sp. URMC 123]|uniref:hypothetical protein n=1 Tax=Streptomyces sp. URMC 123 TaxID=3423403 RepID=UPI003F1D899A
MTYRRGVVVVDTRTGAVGVVVKEHGDSVLLKPHRSAHPHWWAPPAALRLARGYERDASGVRRRGA